MIRDQTIGSARAEKQKNRLTSRVIQNLMTAFLASALTLPSLAAWGMESPPRQVTAKAGEMLPLPPIRYLDSMPWMNWKVSARTPTLKIDIAHVPEHHALGYPEIASGIDLADIELIAAFISHAGSDSRPALR
jgi:hypothetical protein